MRKLALSAIVSMLFALDGFSAVQVASVFSSSMVLQRDRAVPVWGTGTVGESVQVAFGGQTKTTAVGTNGTWRVDLDPMPANAVEQSMVVTGANTVTLTGILVGDVWIAGGQSNMKFRLNQCTDYQVIANSATNDLIRLLDVPKAVAAEPQDSMGAVWEVCSPSTAPPFSAIGVIFALRIQPEIGVPVGIMSANDGSTSVECWVSNDTILDPAFSPTMVYWDDFLANWDNEKASLLQSKLNAHISDPSKPACYDMPHPSVSSRIYPTGCYNAMLAPLMPMAVKGVLWRQGEANTPRAAQYGELMPLMIADWRTNFENPDLPFIQAQLPEWGSVSSAEMREQQWLLSQTQTNVHTAILIDADTGGNVHSPNKQLDGERMALLALAKVYSQPIPHQGPIYKSMQVEGNSIRLSFDHVYGGLMVGERASFTSLTVNPTPAAPIANFAIAGSDDVFYAATATIDGTNIVVSSPSVPNPVAVRYAWEGVPVGCNLYNDAGLPAAPFRTDSLPLTTAGNVEPKINYFIYNDGLVLHTQATGLGQVARTPLGTDPHFESGAYGVYKSGTTVTLNAVPDAGAQFVGWSGDASGTVTPLDVTVSTEKQVTASFSSGQPPAGTVYQDSFDNDTLGTNTGIGGGASMAATAGKSWIDNGDAFCGSGGGGDRAILYSDQSFDVSGGFKLTVVYKTANLGKRFAFGLNDGVGGFTNTDKAWSYRTDTGHAGVGIKVDNLNIAQGLFHNTGAAVSIVDAGQAGYMATDAFQTAVLQVNDNLTYSYSIDGNTASTGILPSFDFSKNYHFAAYAQGQSDMAIESVTIESGSGGSGEPECLAWWRLDETSGTVAADSSGNSIDMNIEGGVALNQPGQVGSAFAFDGVDDYLATPTVNDSSLILQGKTMTFAVWVNAASLNPSSWNYIFGSNNGGISLGVSKGLLRLTVTAKGDAPAGPAIPTNEWVHVACSFDNTSTSLVDNVKYYVNGALAETATFNKLITWNQATDRLGARRNNTLFFHGLIDDARIYDSVLTASEVLAVYNYSGSETFANWLAGYPALGTSTNYTDDAEPDGLNNLLEYALGGNPTSNDAAGFMPKQEMDGTAMKLIYQRQNPKDPALTYTVLDGTNLVSGLVNTNLEVGMSGVVDGFETVTNQVLTTTEDEQFMVLKLEYNNP